MPHPTRQFKEDVAWGFYCNNLNIECGVFEPVSAHTVYEDTDGDLGGCNWTRLPHAARQTEAEAEWMGKAMVGHLVCEGLIALPIRGGSRGGGLDEQGDG